jgi:alpha-L-fucosidase
MNAKNIKKSKILLISLVLLGMLAIVSCSNTSENKSTNNITKADSIKALHDKRMEWFRDAKFGLMIHWGLYSIPAGVWKGKDIPGIGEWIMNHARIPVKQYEKLAKKFDPVKFDADKWVKMAKDAGMKYIVITAKHHDGFAMFHSKASKYNIYDATPFKRDPMKELSDACKKYGLRFGFYYSQTQDWHEPNGAGNDWDFNGDHPKNFEKYLRDKVFPQVRELCTNYGPISVLWFDTPRFMSKAESKELADLVHKLQPNCLIDGRIGNDMGDFSTKGDNQLPTGATSSDWDTPATMNDTWGYKKHDHDWKSAAQLIRAVVEVASKGGTYLLNVGPTAEGVIPQPSVERLHKIGEWLKVNGDAIYDTRMSPFISEPDWGMITVKPGKMFLTLFDWPKNGKLELYGLKNKVNKAILLASSKQLTFQQSEDKSLNHQQLVINVPKEAPDPVAAVVELQYDGNADANNQIEQQPDGKVILYGIQADLHKSSDSSKINSNDIGILNWENPKDWASWNFVVTKPGTFEVSLGSFMVKRGSGRTRRAIYEGGHKLLITVDSQNLDFVTDKKMDNVEKPSPYFTDIVSKAGKITISKPGRYTLNLKPGNIVTKQDLGLTLRWVRLKPI